MKILYLAHRIPYPPNKGDKIRSFHEIKYLSERHEVHLGCLVDDARDLEYEKKLRLYCEQVEAVRIWPKLCRIKSLPYLLTAKPLSVEYFYSKRLQKGINNFMAKNNYDIILCYSSQMAEYIFEADILHGKGRRPKIVMDFVDVDSAKWIKYATTSDWPHCWVYNLEGAKLARYERKVAQSFDQSIFVTEEEERYFRSQNPDILNTKVITNGVDLTYFHPKVSGSIEHPVSPRTPMVLFTGAMDYYANVDAVVWFSREILPLIKQENPEVEFYVVGSNPTKEVLSLSGIDGVKVTGYVPDTRHFFWKADVAVVPLRIARGIQNKMLEPMAMGIPVVVTSEGAKGTKATEKDGIRIADTPKGFADSVLQFIRNRRLREECSTRARRYVETNHQWTDRASELESLLSQ